MQKNWKTILWVGVPVFVVILVAWVFVSLSNSSVVDNYQMSNNDYAPSPMGLDISKEASFAMEPIMAVERNTVAEDSSASYGGDESASTDRLIIKTSSLSMVVENVRDSIALITGYATEKGGFVVSSDVRKSGVAPYGEITIRIPVDVFDNGVTDVKAMGEVESETVNGQDVTEEFVDLDSQLNNLRASEKQFLQIMQRAVKIEDVLAVQRELTWVRRDIERIEGRMKYLTESASLSTLTVYLSTDPDVLPALDNTDKWKPWAEVKTAARSLVEMAKGLANFAIWLVVYIPLWVVIGLVVWLIVRVVKKKKRNVNM